MSQGLRLFLIALAIATGIFLIWYFVNIFAYVIIAAVVSLLGKPIVDFLGHFTIRKRKIPKALRALAALLLMWMLLIFFLVFIIPVIASELQKLSQIDANSVIASLSEPIQYFERFVTKYQVDSKDAFTVSGFISEKLLTVFNVSFFTSFLSSLAGTLGNFFVAIFSITFISFFFLRDENLFGEAVLSIIPDKHTEAFTRVMDSVRHLLGRYFIGIILQISGIFILISIGLLIVGLSFSQSLLIALLAALFNVIPYIGPLIGGAIGIILGIATHLHLDFYSGLLPLVAKMFGVFALVQLIDNMLFQPVIFSNRVNAHPLEIFLVIMMAGSFSGIAGMILAIPVYTVLRVFAKEFLYNFKVVKKLTSKIE